MPAFPYALPLSVPLATLRGPIVERHGWLLRLDHRGLSGWGEAAPLPGFGGEDLGRTQALLSDLVLPALDGWLEGDDLTLPGEVEARVAGAPCARAAIEGALLDLRAQRRGIPLAQLLGAAATTVQVNALVGSAAEAEAAVRAGFTTIKAKAAADVAGQLRGLRAAVGDQVAIRLDANGAWSATEARENLQKIADFSAQFVEQPIAGGAAGWGALAACGVPLAVDEGVRSAADIAAYAGVARVVVLKPMFLGGWGPTAAAVAAARAVGLEVVLTSALDGAIGRAHATAMAAVVGGPYAHGLATGDRLGRDVAAGLPVVAGTIRLDGRPGLGVAP